MPIEVKLPNLGEGVDSGDVADLLVAVGDVVSKDQGLLDIETGKATMQVPSSHAGKVLQVHVKKGQTLKVGDLILTLEGAAAPAAAPAPKAAPPKPAVAPPKPAAPPVAPVAAPKLVAPPPKPVAPAPVAPAPVVAPVAVAAPVVAEAADRDGGDIAAGPAVRRFAREVGVDLARVTGTGPSGRVTREDVLTAVRQAAHTASSSTKSAGTAVAAPAVETSPRDNWGPVRIEKVTRLRKAIAEQMHKSWTTCPRVTNFDDADVTELEKIRVSSKDDYAKKGVKLTSMPFVIKAVAMALKTNPTINASIDMEAEQIIYKDYVNIGIAVDTERGLVVPSLRNADQMSIAEIAKALGSLADSVRESRFSLADLQGSTFTISNLGSVGGTYSTPIINTPEVAILLLGRSRKMPVVVNDQVAVRLMMPLSLSYDHRLVDGGTAARFLNSVIELLQTPSRLLLAP